MDKEKEVKNTRGGARVNSGRKSVASEQRVNDIFLSALKSLNEKFEGQCTFKLGESGIKVTNMPEEIDKSGINKRINMDSKERLFMIDRCLKSTQFTPEERENLLWERDCCKREIENQNDREYVERIAKYKADMVNEDINSKLG